MAAPNMINFNFMTGNTAVMNVTTTAANIVVNAGSSNRVLKINSLMISNIDGTNAADATVEVWRGGIPYRVASTITVPADSTLVVISKDNTIYLEEGDTIRCAASVDGDLQAVCSFENIG